jgi:hypothetical protein
MKATAALTNYSLNGSRPIDPTKSPFLHLIPKNRTENVTWRREQRQKALGDPSYQKLLLRMCKRDVLFWINGFVFTEDPRPPIDGEPRPSSELPFITWEFQDDTILQIFEAIEKGFDLWIVKSRDMGASWMVLMVFTWFFLFHSGKRFKCLSRKEELVDSTEDEDALFPKVDFAISRLPSWMRPAVGGMTRTNLHFFNKQTRGAIDGESTNSDAARGGRRTALFGDEFASVANQKEILAATKDVTRCRIFGSTPKGASNPFAKRVQGGKCRVIWLGWWLHPDKRHGLYTSERGKLKIIDHDYVFPPDFEFILDGELRSPWHDQDERERENDQEHAQETDMNFLGSLQQFFGAKMLDRVQEKYARDAETALPLEDFFKTAAADEWDAFWDRMRGSALRLWCKLDHKNRADPGHTYRFGVDVAAGSGASNSVVHIADAQTGEQVAEFASPFILPEELAYVVKALTEIFKGDDETGPLVIWEDRGPGKQFGKKLWDLKHRHVYFRKNEESLSGKVTDTPGWNPTVQNKRQVLGALRDALKSGNFRVRSRELLDEARYYVYLSGDNVGHSEEAETDDPTGARSNHGDRVIAGALAWHTMRDFNREIEEGDTQKKAEWGSEQWLKEQDEIAQRNPRMNRWSYRRFAY